MPNQTYQKRSRNDKPKFSNEAGGLRRPFHATRPLRQYISPGLRPASLVIDGEECAAHVVAPTESRISSRPIAPMRRKTFFNPWICKHIRFTRESDFLKTPTQNDEHNSTLSF